MGDLDRPEKKTIQLSQLCSRSFPCAAKSAQEPFSLAGSSRSDFPHSGLLYPSTSVELARSLYFGYSSPYSLIFFIMAV
jgi:hypothetical protein